MLHPLARAAIAALMVSCTGRVSPTPVADLPKTAGTFETAKRRLYEEVQPDHRRTLYCGCRYDEDRRVDLASCGMEVLAAKPRATQVEVDHVVPAARIGAGLPCWTQPRCTRGDGTTFKGRACCERSDPWFKAAHNDLHNLFPTVGQVNNDRRDHDFAEVAGTAPVPGVSPYGDCDFSVDSARGTVAPPPGVRGEIARAWLYMADTYGLTLSAEEDVRFRRWDRGDPPEPWERERSRRIGELQGRSNRFVDAH